MVTGGVIAIRINANFYIISLLLVFSLISLVFFHSNQYERAFKSIQFQINCTILDYQGEVLWAMKGSLCSFGKDGSLIRSDGNIIAKHTMHMFVQWKKQMPVHHQIKVYENKVYVLSRSFLERNNRKIGFDILKVLDSKGLLLRSLSFNSDLNTEDKESYVDLPMKLSLRELARKGKIRKLKGVEKTQLANNLLDYELSHVNSFYKIPPNNSAMLEGASFVANDTFAKSIFLIDKEAKTIKKVIQYHEIDESLKLANIHDVQVLESGSILLYVNGSEDDKRTQMLTFNPDTKKLKVLFSGWDKGNKFYSPFSGGVQVFNDRFVIFSDYTDEPSIFIYDFIAQKMIKKIVVPDFLVNVSQQKEFRSFQEAKLGDYTEFLKNNRGI